MISLPVGQIAQVVGGRAYADEPAGRRSACGLVWDSREATEDCMFLAMPGERVDGNDYIGAAIRAGAAAVICTREPSAAVRALAAEFLCAIVVVEDARAALTALARWWRRQLHAVVVGVTGSTGKTSTKEFLRAVLSGRFATVATQGNHNNEIGVPATVLSADLDTEVLIVEMGMRGRGQIAELCEFVRPAIGVVTNIGHSHLELLGSREAIARAKAELLVSLPSSGLAVLNADDEFTPTLELYGGGPIRGLRALTFGTAPEAHVHACNISLDELARPSFHLEVFGRPSADVSLAVSGLHNVSNALAAAAVGSYLGLSTAEIAAALGSVQASGMRMELVHAAGGFTVIDDAYNASPDSMRAALQTLAAMACEGRRIAVLGDMGELGSDERAMHTGVGSYVASCGIDALVCVGTRARDIYAGALDAGFDEGQATWCATRDEAAELLGGMLEPGDIVLVKASRFMELDSIVEGVVS